MAFFEDVKNWWEGVKQKVPQQQAKKEAAIATLPKREPITLSVFDAIKNVFNIQPLEEKTGTQVRGGAFATYPFNDNIKSLLNEQTNIEKVSSKEFGGQSIPRTVLDVIPFHLGEKLIESLPVNEFNDKVVEFLTQPTGGKNQIQLSDTGPETTTHELLHALVDKIPEFPAQKFHQIWEEDKKKFPNKDSIYHFVDKIIEGRKDLYPEDMGVFSRSNERFAYMGALLGKTGVRNFPIAMQGFYQRIFK